MTYLDRFIEVYEKELYNAVLFNPGSYAYGLDKVPDVAARTRAALVSDQLIGTNGSAVRSTCKILGIRPSASAIRAYILQPGDAPQTIKQSVTQFIKKTFRSEPV